MCDISVPMSSSSSSPSQINVRLKFRDQFVCWPIDCSTNIGTLLRCAAGCFKLKFDEVEVSLNARDFFGAQNAHTALEELGIVNGDIIYVKSLEALDDIKEILENETFGQLNTVAERMHFTAKCAGLAPAFFPLQVAAEAKGLQLSLPDERIQSIVNQPTADIVRLTYIYPPAQTSDTCLKFTFYVTGSYINYTCGVTNTDIRNQIGVHMNSHFVKMRLLDRDACQNVRNFYKKPRDLIFQLMDQLIEPVLLQLHEQLNLQPRIHLYSIPAYILTKILAYLSFADLSQAFQTCKHFHHLIRTSEVVWRRNQCVRDLSPTKPEPVVRKIDYMELITEAEIIKEETEDCPSFQNFRLFYRMMVNQWEWHRRCVAAYIHKPHIRQFSPVSSIAQTIRTDS